MKVLMSQFLEIFLGIMGAFLALGIVYFGIMSLGDYLEEKDAPNWVSLMFVILVIIGLIAMFSYCISKLI